MTNLKHIGIYVKDIDKLTQFYRECFNMVTVCEKLEDTGELYRQLYGTDSKVYITKLITEYGQNTRKGEMIELIQMVDGVDSCDNNRQVQDLGLSHISIGVDNISETVVNVKKYGGYIITDIILIGSKYCCFCKDTEGNVIELIQ